MMQTSRRRWLRSLLVAAIALAAVIGGALWWLGAQFPSERLRPLIADQVQQRTGREFAIRGPLAIRLLPRIAVVADDVMLGNARWGSRREMLSVGRARLAVAIGPLLRGRLVVSEVALDRVDLLLETDRRGAGNWVFDAPGRPAAAPAAGGDAALQVAVEQVQLRDARLTWRDGRGGTSRVVDLATAELEPEGATTRVAAQLRLESVAWTIDGRIGRLEDLGTAQADWPVELRASAAGAELALAGQLKGGAAPRTLAAAASATLTKPEALAPWTTAALPLPLSLQARVEARAGALTADELKLSVAGQVLTGRATVATEGPPRFDVQLAARSIDLGRWLPAAAAPGKGAAPVAAGGRRWIFPDTPIPPVALPQATGTLALRIDQLAAPRLPPIAALSLRAELRPGTLQVDPLALQVAGGSVRASLTVAPQAAGGARLGWRAEARGLSVDTLMRAAGTPGYAQGGTVRSTSRVDVTGKTWRALAAGASGEVLVVAENTVLGSGLSPMGTDLLPRLLQLLGGRPQAAARQPTRVDCAVLRLPLAGGVARIDRTIAIETDQLVASASGELRLTDETLSLAVRPTARHQAAKAIPLDLASLVVVRGPILEPSLTLDAKGVAAMAAAIGAAGATGGLSLFAERLRQGSSEPHPCRFAETGKAAAATPPAAPATAPSPPSPAAAVPDLLRQLFKK